MRYVVVGAGAVGATIGGLLHEAGSDVLLVARGPHLAAVVGHGLRLVQPGRTRTIAVPAAAEVGWRAGDVALVAVKSQDTAEALAAVPREVPVVCAQNSVANERWARRAGFTDVYAMCVVLPAGYEEPGVVVDVAEPVPGLLDVGRYPDGVDALSTRIAADLSAAGFRAEADPHVMRWKYRKLVGNLANAVDASCSADDPDSSTLMRAAFAEGEQAITAAGIPIATRAEDRAKRHDLRITSMPGRGGSSMWQSLERGTGSVEAEFLNGEIVALGERHAVATPVNRLLQATVEEMARAGERPGSRSAAELLAAAGVARPA